MTTGASPTRLPQLSSGSAITANPGVPARTARRARLNAGTRWRRDRRDRRRPVRDHPHVRARVRRALQPIVSFLDAHFGGISRRDALAYLPAQIIGCILGAILANAMFSLSAISISTHHRANPAITIGRVFSSTFAGIAPASAPSFIIAQAPGGVLAVLTVRTLYPDVTPADFATVLVPHDDNGPVGDRSVRARTALGPGSQ